MTCKPFEQGGMRGIVCTPRARGRRCRFCDRDAAYLCDFGTRPGKTCSAPMCVLHALAVGPVETDLHHCPDHRNEPHQERLL